MKTTLNPVVAQLIMIAHVAAAPGAALAQASGEIQPTATARSTLQVAGMVGEACPVLITSALNPVDGVFRVEASYASHSATVDYDATRVSLEQIRETIRRQTGFRTAVKE